VKQQEQELETTRDKARDVDIRAKELEYKRNSLIERISNAYKVNVASLNIEIDPEANWEEVQEKIGQLKDQLERMGDVS